MEASAVSGRWRWSRSLAARLRGLAQRRGVTLFAVLLSAFEVLLARLSNQEEFLVGLPFAGRGRPELEPLIGFFADTLVVCARLGEEMTAVELLGRTRQAMLDALLQQEVPFDRLVAELAPQRAGSRMPLVQAVFAYQTDPLASFALHGLAVEPLEVHGGTAKFDLLLTMISPAGERSPLLSRIEYDAELFDAATAERMLGQLRVLLEGMVGDPEGCPLALPLLSRRELHQVLTAWNDTAREYPREATLSALFAAQAARRPEAVAVVSAAERLTYAELDRRANRLARHLRRRGVVPERAVGLCLERSSEALVAMLAVAKAGGVYVPLDPALPSERLAWLLADAGVGVALTRSHLLRGWEGAVPEVVCLDRSAEAIAAESELGLPDEAVADALAYVMYTSGSTGAPKGVGVAHRGIVRLVRGNELRPARRGRRLPAARAAVVRRLDAGDLGLRCSTAAAWSSCRRRVPTLAGAGARAGASRRDDAVADRRACSTRWSRRPQAAWRGVRQLLAGGDVLSAAHVAAPARAASRGAC